MIYIRNCARLRIITWKFFSELVTFSHTWKIYVLVVFVLSRKVGNINIKKDMLISLSCISYYTGTKFVNWIVFSLLLWFAIRRVQPYVCNITICVHTVFSSVDSIVRVNFHRLWWSFDEIQWNNLSQTKFENRMSSSGDLVAWELFIENRV